MHRFFPKWPERAPWSGLCVLVGRHHSAKWPSPGATPSGSSSSFPAPSRSWVFLQGALAPHWRPRRGAQVQVRGMLVPAGVLLLMGTRRAHVRSRLYFCLICWNQDSVSPVRIQHAGFIPVFSLPIFTAPVLRPSLSILNTVTYLTGASVCLSPTPSYPAQALTPHVGPLCPAPLPHANPPYSGLHTGC